MIAPSYDPPIIAATTLAYVGGVLAGYITPTAVDAMNVVYSPVFPVVGSSIAAIAGCSMTSEGVP